MSPARQAPPEPRPQSGGGPRWLRRLAVLGAGMGLLLVAVALLGVPLPAGPLAGLLEAQAGAALQREVEIGTLQLRVGVRPRLLLGDVRVLHPEAGRPDVLALESLELRVALPPLLRRRIHVLEARVQGASVVLDPEALPAAAPASAASEAKAPTADARRGAGGWSLDVDALELLGLSFVATPAQSGEPVRARLDHVRGALGWDESVTLSLAGSYQDVPFAAELAGGPLAALGGDTRDWPLRLELAAAGGAMGLSSRLARVGDALRLEGIQGTLGEAALSGWLHLEQLTTRPRARGQLDVGRIAVALPEPAGDTPEPGTGAAPEPGTGAAPEPGTGAAPEPGTGAAPEPGTGASPPAAGLPAPPRDSHAPGPLLAAARALHGFETDLALRVEAIQGLGVPVEAVSLALRVQGGELAFPIALEAAGIPLSGSLRLEERETQAWLGLELQAEASRVDALADAFWPDAHVRGRFAHLGLEVTAHGSQLRESLANLALDLEAQDAQLTYGADGSRSAAVERLTLQLDERGPLQLQARGHVLGQATVLALETGGTLAWLQGASWPLRLEVEGAGARLVLQGESRSGPEGRAIAASLSLAGAQLAALEPWTGPLPVADAAYALEASLDSGPAGFRLDIAEARLGETTLRGELGRRAGAEPVAFSRLRIDRIDLSQWAAAGDEPAQAPPAPTPGAEGAALSLDVPLLPGGVELSDWDLDLGVGSLRAGGLSLSQLRFHGAIRDAHLPDARIALRVGGAGGVGLEGALSLDLREAPHAAAFRLGARQADLGALLGELGIAEGLDLVAGQLELEIQAQGDTLRALLDHTAVRARAADAHYTLRDAYSGAAVLQLALDEARLTRSGRGEGIALEAHGQLRGEPVTLEMQTPALPLFERGGERHPVALRLETAGATLQVESQVALPVERARLELGLRLEGQRLDEASALLGVALPPIGPYRLASRMRFARADYRLEDLELRLAGSRLRGSGSLVTTGARPRLELALHGETIQLDDFDVERGPAVPVAPAEAPGPAVPVAPAEAHGPASAAPSEAGLATAEARAQDPARTLGAAEALRRLDGRLEVSVAQVLSGEDVLGAGHLVAALEDGRLDLGPLSVEVPGGTASLEAHLAHEGQALDARFRAEVPRFDYGVLARRVDPATDMSGELALELDVAGRAPELGQLLANANGLLDFFAAPENIETDVFDLWAVNLLRFLLPRIDSGPRSRLNCVVARFDLEDGVLRDRALHLDTTGMVVGGRAEVDFGRERVHAVLRPRPKRAQMFTLQTGVELSGSFDDFGVRVPPEQLLASVVRFFTSVVVTPVKRVVGGALPADGRETCQAAWLAGEAQARR